MKTTQLVCFIMTACLVPVAFVGMFYNPGHIVTFLGLVGMLYAIYKEKRW